ncbi:DUF3817 domain-containing protein [Microbacterium imperiale]|uniref:Membrane protein n=1 Tax=Microbacterium imperiale TaxID=33884 RepID=A0A9W6HGY5_9MICO|nr:DUF3817 domain-containing protein [Microbacterium imperiale]MBP2422180.1 integral membrane protein [Microbacterium imperiale]MDS0200337.1 DUF3817 domain-containing protein [Microbacterium imperiale]BFE39501.1 DUF3817 domain-containing protein [Microbacterium imperiale]GLJ79632.1 membrane protein [Microbacterium imperiale]
MFRSPLTAFRFLAFAEAVSWTLLIGGLIVRALFDQPVAVTIGGGIHGFVFLCYGATAVLVAWNNRWRIVPTLCAVGAAVVPYATIPTEIVLRRRGLLAGEWRTEATDDPRDARALDRFLRWFVRRPAVLAVILAVGIVAAYVLLLIIGPPGRA